MLARRILKKPPPDKAGAAEGQTRPSDDRFLLLVDGQTKRSFSSKEIALKAGITIKKVYPVVAVSVVDTDGGTAELINA